MAEDSYARPEMVDETCAMLPYQQAPRGRALGNGLGVTNQAWHGTWNGAPMVASRAISQPFKSSWTPPVNCKSSIAHSPRLNELQLTQTMPQYCSCRRCTTMETQPPVCTGPCCATDTGSQPLASSNCYGAPSWRLESPAPLWHERCACYHPATKQYMMPEGSEHGHMRPPNLNNPAMESELANRLPLTERVPGHHVSQPVTSAHSPLARVESGVHTQFPVERANINGAHGMAEVLFHESFVDNGCGRLGQSRPGPGARTDSGTLPCHSNEPSVPLDQGAPPIKRTNQSTDMMASLPPGHKQKCFHECRDGQEREWARHGNGIYDTHYGNDRDYSEPLTDSHWSAQPNRSCAKGPIGAVPFGTATPVLRAEEAQRFAPYQTRQMSKSSRLPVSRATSLAMTPPKMPQLSMNGGEMVDRQCSRVVPGESTWGCHHERLTPSLPMVMEPMVVEHMVPPCRDTTGGGRESILHDSGTTLSHGSTLSVPSMPLTRSNLDMLQHVFACENSISSGGVNGYLAGLLSAIRCGQLEDLDVLERNAKNYSLPLRQTEMGGDGVVQQPRHIY